MTFYQMASIQSEVKSALFMRKGAATFQSMTSAEWRREAEFLADGEKERAIIIADFLEAETKRREMRRVKARIARIERNDLFASVGMTRVRGNLGGVYYE